MVGLTRPVAAGHYPVQLLNNAVNRVCYRIFPKIAGHKVEPTINVRTRD